jgi:hypothetical protein
MQFSLAFIRNPRQAIIKNFGGDGNQTKGSIIELEDLSRHNYQALFYPRELESDSNLLAVLETDGKIIPVRAIEDIGQTAETAETLTYEVAQKIYSKTHEQWVLHNNLVLLEELNTVTNHLKELFPNDRTTFFEELWFIFKRNLGARDLRVIYNDLEKGQNEGDKNRLVRVCIDGKKRPEPKPGGEFADKLMGHYDRLFGQAFDIAAYEQDKGQLVALISVNKSPAVIMAEVPNLSRLSKALFKALFETLQSPR